MKKSLSLLLIFMMVLTLCPAVSAEVVPVTVAPGINTLASAVQSASAGDTLLLGDGIYYLTETLVVDKSITIRAADGKNPTITGSNSLTGWESVGDGIYRAPYSESTLPMLIENGTTATIARFPNAPLAPKFTDGYIFATSASYTEGASSGSVFFPETLPTGILAENLEMICWGSAETNYANSVVKVSSITNGRIDFTGEVKYGVTTDSRFYIRGDKALIDEVGEYALSDGYIYYKPHSSTSLETSVTVSRAFGEVIRVLADNTVLSGVSIKGTALGFNGENTALGLFGSSICVDNCTFDGIGSRAINMGGANNTVQNSTFRNIGTEAILVNGARQLVRNNDIAATGKENGGTAAISLASQNSTVRNNKITNAPRWGINVSYGDFKGNVIEYNDISNCNTDSSDTAPIYMYYTKGTPQEPNIIRYNKVHDSNIYGGMGFGIYLDDNCDYFEIYGNILYNLGYDNLGYVSGIIMVKGVGNDIHHNIIANNQNTPVKYDANNFHGAGNVFVQKYSDASITLQNKMHHNVFYENVNNTMYCVYHPEPLSGIAECDYNLYYASENRGGDGNSKYHVNVVGAWGDMRYGWQTSYGFDTHSLFDVDPLFVDGANNDFRLSENSPLWDMGWDENLPTHQMGLLSEDAPLPEALPTQQPNEFVPLPTADPTKHLLSMSGIYKENGANNDRTTYQNGILSMIKDYTGAGDVLVWANDATKTVNSDTTYTLRFEAEVSGGYAESPWDGYHVYLRNYSVGLHELIGLYTTAEGRTGVKSGNVSATVAAGKHTFELVYNKDSVAVYCDGEYLFTNNSLGFTGDLHCFQIANGHSEATFAQLTLSNFNVYTGDVHTAMDPSATAAPTELPTPTPTPTQAPTAFPTISPDALLTMTGIYKENGADNNRTTFINGTLSMVKDYPSLGDVLVWANDSIKTVTDETVYTVSFRASVSGGTYGNEWDGYTIMLRNYNVQSANLIHISTLADGRTGLSTRPGNAPVAVEAGEHYYEIVYTASWAKVYCDGVLVVENNSLGFTGDLHCFQIQNGHTDATGSALTLSDFAVYGGDAHAVGVPSIEVSTLTNGSFTATLTAPEVGGILLVAEFDSQEKFMKFTTYEVEETVTITLSSSAQSAKVMWWNTVSGMTPITEMKSISR